MPDCSRIQVFASTPRTSHSSSRISGFQDVSPILWEGNAWFVEILIGETEKCHWLGSELHTRDANNTWWFFPIVYLATRRRRAFFFRIFNRPLPSITTVHFFSIAETSRLYNDKIINNLNRTTTSEKRTLGDVSVLEDTRVASSRLTPTKFSTSHVIGKSSFVFVSLTKEPREVSASDFDETEIC